MLRLKPFTDNDWAYFAGCESDEPQICFFTARTRAGDELEFAAVLDGPRVEFTCLDSDGDPCSYRRAFTTDAEAREVAETLLRAFETMPFSDWHPLLVAAISKPEAC